MLMKNIRIFGDTSKVVESPPPVIIEFMDKDTVVSGRGTLIAYADACTHVCKSIVQYEYCVCV